MFMTFDDIYNLLATQKAIIEKQNEIIANKDIIISNLSKIIDLFKAIKAIPTSVTKEEQEYISNDELDVEEAYDCIRRKDIGLTDIEILLCNGSYKEALKMILDKVEKAPSVIPQHQTAYWRVVSDGYGDNISLCECSKCKDTVWVYKDADRKWNYCPNCGARMVELKENK